jgi:hypothetical protein
MRKSWDNIFIIVKNDTDMNRTLIADIIHILIMSLFLYAAVSKIMDGVLFQEQLAVSPLLGSVAVPAAWILPKLELAVVLLLLVPRWRLKGLYTFLVMMVLFTLYIGGMLAFSDHLPCSCGGLLQELSWKAHMGLNAAFIALAVIAIKMEKRGRKNNARMLTTAFA